ncbi:MAG: phage tail protein, partial [Pseudomonadota bacterium]
MASVSPNHGSRVFESPNTPVLIRTSESAIGCIFGTAPDADASIFPYDKPILVNGNFDLDKLGAIGDAGTLKDALDAAYDQTPFQCFLVRIEEGVDTAATIANMVGDRTALTGVHSVRKIESLYGHKFKPRIYAAPGFSAVLTSDGIASYTITNGGSGYTEETTTITAGGDGVGSELLPVITDGVLTDIIIRNPGRGFSSAPTITVADSGSGTGATVTVTVGTVGNPVVYELIGLMSENEYRALMFVDGPNTTDANAKLAAEKYGSKRIEMIDPELMVYDQSSEGFISYPPSAHWLGV